MSRTFSYLAGICVILVFSIYPVRLADALCCFGVVLGGLLSTVLMGRGLDGRMEAGQALMIGARVGVYAAISALMLNLIFHVVGTDSIPVDPVPDFFYQFFWELAEAVVDIAGTSRIADNLPGIWGRFVFQIFSNALFGAFGGAVGMSLFQTDSVEE